MKREINNCIANSKVLNFLFCGGNFRGVFSGESTDYIIYLNILHTYVSACINGGILNGEANLKSKYKIDLSINR